MLLNKGGGEMKKTVDILLLIAAVMRYLWLKKSSRIIHYIVDVALCGME